ncbi:hypothetical protein HYU45_04445 [Candidatus Daviesbacteria bacterium]|nr:hypothetical protein [Candidatus Daviesbacteria bacterium]
MERPLWIPMQEMVSPGSIGEELLKEIPGLGERLRPETILGQPLKPSLFVPENPGLATYADILGLSAEEFAKFNPRLKLSEKLDIYLKNLSILPHSRLLAAIYGLPLFPAPPDREQEIVEGVEDAFYKMPYQTAVPVLVLRFGLHDGFRRSPEETGRQLERSVTRARVRQVEGEGLRYLRHETRIKEYLILPEASLGKEIFGAVLVNNLPDLNGRVSTQALKLPAGIIREASYLFNRVLSIEDLVIEDLSRAENPIPEEVKHEVSLVLQRRVREVADKRIIAAEQRVQVETVAKAAKDNERRSQVEEPKDNFISEYKLTLLQLERADEMPLTNLGLTTRSRNALKRAGIKTVGALLRMNRQDLQGIRNVGIKLGAEIVSRIPINY